MAKAPKRIIANRIYHIVARTRNTIPMVPTLYMNLILEGMLARAICIYNMEVIVYKYMGNHFHMLVVAKDKSDFKAFYGYIQKRITEVCKRLTGRDEMTIWDGKVKATEVASLRSVLDQIVYIYCNASKAGLVDRIEEYPGLSSWEALSNSECTLNVETTTRCPWIPEKSIQPLRALAISQREDESLYEELVRHCRKDHPLKVKPWAWLRLFYGKKVDNATVERCKSLVLSSIRRREDKYRLERSSKGRTVLGAQKLARQALLKTWIPKKTGKTLIVICSDTKIRLQRISEYAIFRRKCKACYKEWKRGNFNVEWPPGAYRPPFPNLINHYDTFDPI